jgi:hypothetical protein
MRFKRKNAYNAQRFFPLSSSAGRSLFSLNALTPNSFFALDIQKP